MEKPFNWFAQGIADGALRKAGTITFEHPVITGDLAIDIWFQPDPAGDGVRRAVGLLGRIAAEPCVIEPFHDAPRPHHVNDCVAKAFALHIILRRRTRGPREEEDAAAVPVPRVWILAAGRPNTAMDAWAMRPLTGRAWPNAREVRVVRRAAGTR